MDSNLLPSFRKMGIGSLLLDTAEKEAAPKSQIIGIGVGLYAGADGGYGPAQRLYIKRGYIPDGKGVTYHILSELNKMNERTKVTVRRYQDGDAKHIASIYYNTIHTVNAKDYTKEQLNAWAPYHNNYDAWKEKCVNLNPFVAVIEDTIVGFAEFEPNGHIDCFYVDHKFQGAGVGTALMREIEMEAREKLLPRIYAEVSITAKPFFASKGFQVIKQQTVRIRGVELINFLMEQCFVTCELLSSDHIPSISDTFNQIGWNKPASLFEEYLKEQEAGERLGWVAHVHDQFAGYVTLKWSSSYPSFQEQNIPEIMDLNVLPHYRKMGIGSLLLDTVEKEAATKSQIIGICVGLYAGEDGQGLTYNCESTIPGNSAMLLMMTWYCGLRRN